MARRTAPLPMRGDRVRISVGRGANGDIVLTLADTGIGMRPEDIRIALTPFQQVENELGRGTVVSAHFPGIGAIRGAAGA